MSEILLQWDWNILHAIADMRCAFLDVLLPFFSTLGDAGLIWIIIGVALLFTRRYRKTGIAGHILNMAVEDLRSKKISPAYLVTDHIGFYERYGWEFLCMVQGDGEEDMTRMYIHR